MTWREPVRGRFSFTPNERQRARGQAPVPRRSVVQGPPIDQQVLDKHSCYFCGKSGGYHERGCPRAL